MSETREHSYYEIALTNRQVMSVFIVLLVCLLASFVSGIWIGRQGSGVRVQTADAQLIEVGGSDSTTPLGEMDFFSPPGETEQPAVPDQGSADASPAENQAVDPEPAAIEETSAGGDAGAAQPPRTAEPPAVSAPSATEPAASPANDFLYVQVFSSTDRNQAQSIVDRLRQDGYAAFLSSVEVDARLMHRVRIGPYAERDEAEAVAQTVQRKHKLSTWITP